MLNVKHVWRWHVAGKENILLIKKNKKNKPGNLNLLLTFGYQIQSHTL